MRKNLLASIGAAPSGSVPNQARAGYASRGASRSMMLSIEEMAENAKKLVAGEAIISLDPALIDNSFVSDRVDDDDQEFELLRGAIAQDGQLQPILVRPHPTNAGRYMVVFGHRRTKAARELGIHVRAVVRDVAEIAHIIAQGQENSRRTNLSFIEKALFARKLQAMGQTKDTIKSALGVDDTLLSRMLSVVEIVPAAVLDALGSLRSVGRDRWEELKRLVQQPGRAERAAQATTMEDFLSRDGPGRFAYLLEHLKRSGRVSRKPRPSSEHGTWQAPNKDVTARYVGRGRHFNLALGSKDAEAFGRFIASRLEGLYRDFKADKPINPGG